MRNRLIGLLLALAVVALAIAVTTAEFLHWPGYARFYQHTASPAPKPSQAEAAVFTSHLPLVLIDTGGVAIEESPKVPATISIIDHADGNNSVADAPTLTTASLINVRGATSLFFEKDQYRLNLVENLNSTKRVALPVMGMPAATDWVLNGPYLDKSLMRNYMMYNLAGEIMEWSPNVRYCEVFLNGSYDGLYLMLEAVTVGEHRVDVSRQSTAQGDVGFLLLRDREGSTKTPIRTYSSRDAMTRFELGVEFPGPADLTENNVRYIVDRVSAFEEKLYAEYGVIDKSYLKDIDVRSFVDYYILNEFCMNRDAGFFSTYTYGDPRGKLTMGPVWDYNNCFNNHFDSTPVDQLLVANNNWFSLLVLDRTFAELAVWRYRELRKTVLAEDRLLRMIDEIAAYLGPAVGRNFERWGTSLKSPLLWLVDGEKDRNSYSFEEAVTQLKDCIVARGRFLDENLETLLRLRIVN